MVGTRAILFDAVGTLMYASPSVVDVYYVVGQRHGSRLSRQQVAERFTTSFQRHYRLAAGQPRHDERLRWRRVVESLFADVPAQSGPIFSELWQHFACPAHWRLFDDVAPVWNWLRGEGYRLGIASNFDERLPALCAALCPLNQAEWVLHSSDLGVCKPHGDFFRQAARHVDLPPAEILLVGDDPRADCQGARAAGWAAVWLDREAPSGCNDRIASLRELPDWLHR